MEISGAEADAAAEQCGELAPFLTGHLGITMEA
jgi:hypothetical protein